jgi:hypothetical protein
MLGIIKDSCRRKSAVATRSKSMALPLLQPYLNNYDVPQLFTLENVEQKKGVLSTVQVPITSALLSTTKNPNIPQLQSLEPQGVENYDHEPPMDRC